MAAADSLVAALNNACARLAELDAMPLDERARGVVDSSGVRWDWNALRASYTATIDSITKSIGPVRTATQGPFTITNGVVRG
jgi:hypothetical protein